MLFLVVDVVLVVVAARRLAGLGGDASPEVRQLLAWVAGAAQIIVVLQIAGFVVRSFSSWAVLGIQAACTALVVWRTPPAGRMRAPSWWTSRARSGRPAWTSRHDAAMPVVLGAVLGGALVGRGALALTFPPYGYDPLWYHFPGIARWLQVGHFGTVEWSQIVGRYPADSDLLIMFPAVFVRSMHALAIGGIVAAVVFALGTRALAHGLGLGARASWFAGLLAGASPVAVAQTYTGNVDLFIAAWAVTAAAMTVDAVRACELRDSRRFVLAVLWVGVACGLLAGSKFSGITPAAAAAVTVGVLARRSPLRRFAWRAPALVAVVAFAMGGSWYVRNSIAEHNPISPFRVAAFGHEVFAGSGSPADWLSAPPEELAGLPKPVQLVGNWVEDAKVVVRPRALFEQEPRGGLGPFWVLLGVPSLVAVGWLAARRRVGLTASVVAPVTVLVVAALGQPYWWWSRFVLSLAPLGAIAFAWLAPRLRRVRTIEAVAVALAAYGIALSVVHLGYPDKEWSRTVVAAGRLAVEQRGDVTYADVMASQAWNDRVPHDGRVGLDASIAEAGGFVLLPLFGNDLSHRVVARHEGDALDRFDAVVVRADGPMVAEIAADARFVRTERAPVGLAAFVRR